MKKELEKLIELLEEAIDLYRRDRTMAIDNYDQFRDQLDNILKTGMESSEEGKIEKEVNIALRSVFESAKRLDSVIMTVTKILVTQLNTESRERTAGILAGKNNEYIDAPVNISKLLENKKEENED